VWSNGTIVGTQKLSELLDTGHVAVDVETTDMPHLLRKLSDLLVERGRVTAACGEKLSEALLERESLGSTAVGLGVALPHAYVVEVPQPLLMIARLKTPLAEGISPDGRPVDLVFLLTGPASAQRHHVKVLARVVRLLHDEAWVAALRSAETSEAVIEAVRAVEARHA
jgi:PTS system nitrogen regulatory IIA component